MSARRPCRQAWTRLWCSNEAARATINVGTETIVSPQLAQAVSAIPKGRVVLELIEDKVFDQYTDLSTAFAGPAPWRRPHRGR